MATEVTPWLSRLRDWIFETRFTIGDTAFSMANVGKLLLYLALVAIAARLLRRLLVRRLFPRAKVDSGTAHAIGNIASYTVVVIGTLVGLQAAGIDLSTLTVLFGALGVGIGFGLQTIASNFISGIIVLVEQPIRVGDRIQVGDLDGRVLRVRARATEIETNDGIAVIVPNSEFISQQVINWSHGDNRVRVHVPVGVAYGSDIEKVKTALLEAAASVDAVLKDPPPKVWMLGFGDSSLDFELLGWTQELLHQRGEFMSRVNFAIHAALARHEITIPFPQRDLHLKDYPPVAETPGVDSPNAST